MKNMSCSNCEHAKWSEYYRAYYCEHPRCKIVSIFKGITHPRYCPIDPKGKYRKLYSRSIMVKIKPEI